MPNFYRLCSAMLFVLALFLWLVALRDHFRGGSEALYELLSAAVLFGASANIRLIGMEER